MYDSKLFYLLKTLKSQSREILEFEKFVKSPYFNSRVEVVDLLLFIKKFWNKSEIQQKSNMNKQRAYQSVFKKKGYDALKINECISQLSQLLELFFVVQEVKKNTHQQDLLMTEVLKTRGIDKYYFKKTERLEKKLSAIEKKDSACNSSLYSDLMWLNEHVYYHPNNDKSSNHEDDLRFGKMMEYLDLHYATKKLQYACEAFARRKVFGATFSPRLLDEVVSLATTDFDKNSTLKVYSAILDLYKHGEVDKIQSIKQQIFDLIENYPISNKLNLVINFLNAIPQHPGRLNLFFELYKYAIDNKLIIEHGFISPDHFTNIIHVGCAMKKDDWVQDFITQFIPFLNLNSDKQENIQALFEAYSNFHKGQYNEAFSKLLRLKINNFSYGLRYHTLLIMTIIDGKEKIGFKYDFENCCKNFKKFLARKLQNGEISTAVKGSCNDFINMSNKLYNPKFRELNTALLVKELDGLKEIPYKDWLKAKLMR